ncbi:MAG TPA: hypothetical protein VJ483_08575 [Holophagaceae bacterium]|nr:hypothetical protein [Holophagaceae bacterium]
MNQVVARFQDGRMLKGLTNDFLATKDYFHLTPAGCPPDTEPTTVHLPDLKAVFFVKDLKGKPAHKKMNEFDPLRTIPGRKIKVVFKDGEVLKGTTQGYQAGRPGFFLVPVDPLSNNERCYVVTAAAKEIAFV